LAVVFLVAAASSVSCRFTSTTETNVAEPRFVAPGEFEPQEYIWLFWNEAGFLGGPPFGNTLVEMMRALTPHAKVRLMFGNWTGSVERDASQTPLTPEAAETRLRARLVHEGIDLRRVELFHSGVLFGALQDPGPTFLRRSDGQLAVADYGFAHPDPAVETIDRSIAARLGLPTVSSKLVSEGGARQSNGKGTIMLVESVEFDRNPGWTRERIAAEHLRVNGARKVVWLKSGPKEEQWGKLEDGRWGIGTGGHIDQFARFVDPKTIVLAQVVESERDASPILRETYERMERNAAILSKATDQDGNPFRVLRVPMPQQMTWRVNFDELTRTERYWFEGAMKGESIEFYLPASYLNFILANGVLLTSKYWREGEPESMRERDALARDALAVAFPDRRIIQIDARAMLHDGAGLHCWSCNQPFATAASR